VKVKRGGVGLGGGKIRGGEGGLVENGRRAGGLGEIILYWTGGRVWWLYGLISVKEAEEGGHVRGGWGRLELGGF